MISLLTVLLFSLLTISGYKVPATIKLDGSISKEEWAGASGYNLSAGGKLYVLQEGRLLYLGLKGDTQGWAHVYIHWKDSIKVLHASAALGEQLYTRNNDNWKRQSTFNWELRESVFTEALQQKQNEFFVIKGWVANNNNTGDKTTLEYKIDLDRFPGAAFVALYARADSYSSYPSGLTDHTQLKALVTGNSPDDLQFNPATWATFR